MTTYKDVIKQIKEEEDIEKCVDILKNFRNELEPSGLLDGLTSINDPEPIAQQLFEGESPVKTPKKEIKLTDEFKDILNILENTNESVFITGKAGTGKSTLFNEFITKIKKDKVVLAPTGVAALNVRGQTIHSFFKFPPTVFHPTQLKEDKQRKRILRDLEMMIIDEVSMVRSDIMFGMDLCMRVDRGSNLPFGGVQMVFIGDLFQLPPVVTSYEKDDLYSRFTGPYFFNSPDFNKFNYHFKELTQIFRQSEEQEKFRNLLNNIRVNCITDDDLSLLNSRYTTNPNNKAIYLTAHRAVARRINNEELAKIGSIERVFTAKVTGKYTKVKELSEDEVENKFPAPYKLKLKEGAKIMMVKNDKQGRWVNGSIGFVKIIKPDYIIVNIDDQEYFVNMVKWEEVRNVAVGDQIVQQVVASFEQFPIKLAYAVTIHKSQGKTFDNVFIDVGSGAFASGQVYVALSRCTTLEGVALKTKINKTDIIVDDEVVDFYTKAN